jgi:hypothetical protein
MSGRLFAAKSIEDYAASGLHQALFHGYRLRLAIFYRAPIETLKSISLAVEPHVANILGMSFGNEWVFLRNIVGILSGDDARPDLALLEGCASCEFGLQVQTLTLKLPIMLRGSTF